MRFTTTPVALKAAFGAVKSGLGSHTAMPVLDNILFSPSDDGGSFRLIASDGDMTVSFPLAVEETDGLIPFLVPAKVLGSYIASLTTDLPLTFEVDKREVHISDIFSEGYDGNFSFVSEYDPSEYPLPRELMGDVKSFVLPAEAWCSAVAAARYYCASDELRPVMNGVYADFHAAGVTIAASDSKKLFRESIALDNTGLEGSDRYGIILPSKLVGVIAGIVSQSGNLTLQSDGRYILVSQADITIYSRCIEGRYPRYEAVIPRSNTREVVVNRQQLTTAINRVLIAANTATQAIALTFDGQSSLSLQAQDIDSSKNAVLRIPTVSQHDSNIRIGMRGNYLKEVLNSFKRSDNIKICMLSPDRAVTFFSCDGGDRLCLTMPMQLTDI